MHVPPQPPTNESYGIYIASGGHAKRRYPPVPAAVRVAIAIIYVLALLGAWTLLAAFIGLFR